MWENVEKLLEEANTSFSDVMQIIVYLRDSADYTIVKQMFDKRFPAIPTVITLAPVCRPTWLIEMECIAVSDKGDTKYKDF
jgi:enamine deaminase RidA (YjgF/YER057c/UK114 family)